MPLLSVVIPTYNRKQSLLRTLDALAQQTLSPEQFEVLVVSDGSTDGTAEAVSSVAYPYRFRYLEQANLGPSAARNNGMRASCGNVVVYVDDDIEPVPEFLALHAAAHDADDQLVLIGPQSMPPRERFPVWIAWEHRMLEMQYVKFRSGEWKIGPNNLYSGNFSVRRANILEVGGFDERFRRQEDVELGFRLAANGLHFAFEGRAIGYHRPERTFEAWFKTPYLYGVRDVQMTRDKGQTVVMALAQNHYRERNVLTRAAARLVIGRKLREKVAFGTLPVAIRAADLVGLRKLALTFCSLTFNLRYLQGMADEIGGSSAMWNAIISEPVERQEEQQPRQ